MQNDSQIIIRPLIGEKATRYVETERKYVFQVDKRANKLDIKRVIMRKLILGIANGKVICDDNLVYEAEDIRVGLFKE